MPVTDAGEPQLVERVGHGAGIEPARRERVVHIRRPTSNVSLSGYQPVRHCQYAKHIALPVPASER